MRSNSILTTFLMVCFSISFSFAQTNFITGSVTNLNGEVVNGFIDYQNWFHTLEKISFKKNETSATVYYTPLDIKGFSVKKQQYVSATVDIELSSDEVKKLTDYRTLDLEKKEVFLQTLVLGEKSLFELSNERRTFLYILQEDKYVFLGHKKYIRNSNGRQIVDEYKGYISQLVEYLKDCPKVQVAITQLKYTPKEIKKVFDSYYDCMGKEPELSLKSKIRFPFRIRLIAGISRTGIKFSSDGNYRVTNGDFSKAYNFTGGVAFEALLPRDNQRFTVIQEITYSKFSNERYSEEIITPANYSKFRFELNYAYLNYNPIFQARITSFAKALLYLKLGGSFGLPIKKSAIGYQERKTTSGDPQFSEISYPIEPLEIQYGFLSGIGISLNKFSGEVRYLRRAGNSRLANENYQSRTSHIDLMVGYRF